MIPFDFFCLRDDVPLPCGRREMKESHEVEGWGPSLFSWRNALGDNQLSLR